MSESFNKSEICKRPPADSQPPDRLQPLREHPIFPLTNTLAEYIGVERDLVQFSEFLSLAAGRMAMPLNVEVITDHWIADLHIANRVLDLLPNEVQRVDTDGQFRSLERTGFKDIAVILVRDNHSHAFRNFTERTARPVTAEGFLPSLWRVSDRPAGLPGDLSTLRLLTTGIGRGLGSFGAAFAAAPAAETGEELTERLTQLPKTPCYLCEFRAKYSGVIPPAAMLVLERLLQTFAALRINLPGSSDAEKTILAMDYHAVRALLVNLPLTPVDRALSADALVTAETIFGHVMSSEYQLSLPDRSPEGNKWFSRTAAIEWTGTAYNTVKKHLGELEEASVLLPSVTENNRQRGRQLYYRFAPEAKPPFLSVNPFEALPDLTGGIDAP